MFGQCTDSQTLPLLLFEKETKKEPKCPPLEQAVWQTMEVFEKF